MSTKRNFWELVQQFVFFFVVISFLQMLLGYLGLTTFSSQYSPDPMNAIDAPFAIDQKIEKSALYTWDRQESTLHFDIKTGNLVQCELKNYPIAKDSPEKINTLFQGEIGNQYLAEQLLFVDDTGAHTKPDPVETTFQLIDEYTLKIQKHYAQGVILEILYHSENAYLLTKEIVIHSNSSESFKAAYYSELRNTDAALISGTEKGFRMFQGASFHTDSTKYSKYPFSGYKKTKPFAERSAQGWFSMSQRYFATAQKNDFLSSYYSRYYQNTGSNKETYVAGSVSDLLLLEPNTLYTLKAELYSGPEDKNLLMQVETHLPYVIDFGFFWPVCNFLLSALTVFKDFIGDWGLSIICLTLAIRIAIFAISAPHQGTLRKLQSLAPKQEKLRKEISDDLAYNKALLELHRREKINYFSVFFATIVNPLIQIPVLFGFYSLLMESIVLRQSSFFTLIPDLSAPDQTYILAVLLLFTGVAQQKISAKIPNPDLALVLGAMPYIFAVLSLTFPSGLVLYWIINNTFSLIQEGYSRFSHGISRSS